MNDLWNKLQTILYSIFASVRKQTKQNLSFPDHINKDMGD